MKTERELQDERIANTLKDTNKVREFIQAGIHDALRKHKLLGNPVCESRNGKIVWIQPEQIPV